MTTSLENNPFFQDLKQCLEAYRNPERAMQMEAYLKNHFTFFGIAAPTRKEIWKELKSIHKQTLQNNTKDWVMFLFKKKEREYHYFALEIANQFWLKKMEIQDINEIEFLLSTNSWWDSVDVLSKYVLGAYLKRFPEQIPNVLHRFIESDNMWLQRSCILFQLGYKKETKTKILFEVIDKLKSKNTFFIQKAIGWALREYAKVDANLVFSYVQDAKLEGLSRREALKHFV